MLRWSIQNGVVVIPKSVTEKRILENFKVFDFELDAADMSAIESLDRGWRILDLTYRDGDHPYFPFNEEY